MKLAFCLCNALLLFGSAQLPALANVPPGPLGITAVILMPLSIVLFSLLGGAYLIFAKQRGNDSDAGGWTAKIIGASVLIALVPIAASFALPGLLIFSSIGIGRSVRMINWSRQSKENRSDPEGSSSGRLLACALALLLSIGGLNFVFFTWGVPAAKIKPQRRAVLWHMHAVQVAAESYAMDHKQAYPKNALDAEFEPYLPGGALWEKSVKRANLPEETTEMLLRRESAQGVLINPVDGSPRWLTNGSVRNVQLSRITAEALPLGVVEYSAICDKTNTPHSYAIRGGDPTGQTVSDAYGRPLVLSKD